MGGQGGEQVAAFVGDDFDPVFARVEGEFLRDLVVRPRPGGRAPHAGGDAVQAPFDAPDALAAIRYARRDGEEVLAGAGAGLVRGDDHGGWRPGVEHLVEVDDPGGSRNLAIGIARQRLAHQIGVEQRLMHLPDSNRFETAHDGEHICIAMRTGEETFGCDREPFAGLRSHHDGKFRLLPVKLPHIPKADGSVRAAGYNPLAIAGEGGRPDLVRMPGKALDLAPACHVPEFERVVIAPRQDQSATRRKGNRTDGIRMPGEAL